MARQDQNEKTQGTVAYAVRTLPRWNELPDFGLYMDQVLSLMERYLGAPAPGEKGITASMVNNYVKIGVLPAPQKKKYARIHLASLLVICALKPVLPLALIQDILAEGMGQRTPEAFYDQFCEQFEVAERKAMAAFDVKGSCPDTSTAIVIAALNAQAQRNIAVLLSGYGA